MKGIFKWLSGNAVGQIVARAIVAILAAIAGVDVVQHLPDPDVSGAVNALFGLNSL